MSQVDLQPIMDELKAEIQPHVQAIAAALVHKGLLPVAKAYAQASGSPLIIGVEGIAEPTISAALDQVIAGIKL